MTNFPNLGGRRRGTSVLAALAFIFAGALCVGTAPARPDQPLTDAVGTIEGEAISVSGPMNVEVVGGQVKTMLRSGSDVRVKSGTARIELVEGGQITICGPAHLSVLKSGGSLTVALDTGTIHVHIQSEPALTIYTPQIQAQPVPIGDAPEDVVVGFDTPGAMCIRARRGAVRLEQQLTGQSLIVPQSGDVLVVNGQLDSLRPGTGHCPCELEIAKAAPGRESAPSQPAASDAANRDAPVAKPADAPVIAGPSGAKEEPVYQVFMPPLVYDAKAKVQPEIDPKMIFLVRRVRVRPTLIYQGRVEGEAVAALAPPPFPPVSTAAVAPKPAVPPSDSLFDRVRNFVRRLWSRS